MVAKRRRYAGQELGLAAPLDAGRVHLGRVPAQRRRLRARIENTGHLAEVEQLEHADFVGAIRPSALGEHREQCDVGFGQAENRRTALHDDRRGDRFLQRPSLHDRGVAGGVEHIVWMREHEGVQSLAAKLLLCARDPRIHARTPSAPARAPRKKPY